jgi:hypothetical protein
MANMSARNFITERGIEFSTIGGFAQRDTSDKFQNEKLYHGPSWFSEKMQDVY